MNVNRELQLSLGALIVFNLALSFSAIGLLSRMGPAFDDVLMDNVPSLEAADEMLVALALDGERTSPESWTRIDRALERAKLSVSEQGEQEVLARLRHDAQRARAGVSGAREDLVKAIVDLATLNRQAMRRADVGARRLGLAGGWAAAFLGAMSLWVCLFVAFRLRRRLLVPLVELADVLRAHESGDRFRRCAAPDAGDEWKYALSRVDRLLDEEQARSSGFGRLDPLSSRPGPRAAKSD